MLIYFYFPAAWWPLQNTYFFRSAGSGAPDMLQILNIWNNQTSPLVNC
jgi:hypothetical protein